MVKKAKKRPKGNPVSKKDKYLLRALPQRPTGTGPYDVLVKAKKPGKRKTDWGTVYWETRENRSDKPGKLR